jgi:hypothetical protein
MGENGDVAVSEVDEAAPRRIAAGEAVGAHSVEARRLGSPVDQHRRGQAQAVPAALERCHRFVVRRCDDEPVDAAAYQRLDTAALVRRVLAGGNYEEIIAVAFGEPFDPMSW